MRKFLVAGRVVAAAPWCFAAEQARDVPEFKSITSHGAFKLVVNVGRPQTVRVTADDDVLARISTKTYYGKPAQLTKTVGGIGSVHSGD
jgi:hypothetical protein